MLRYSTLTTKKRWQTRTYIFSSLLRFNSNLTKKSQFNTSYKDNQPLSSTILYQRSKRTNNDRRCSLIPTQQQRQKSDGHKKWINRAGYFPTASLKSLPGLNTGTLFAGIDTASPVRGSLPSRALRSCTS